MSIQRGNTAPTTLPDALIEIARLALRNRHDRKWALILLCLMTGVVIASASVSFIIGVHNGEPAQHLVLWGCVLMSTLLLLAGAVIFFEGKSLLSLLGLIAVQVLIAAVWFFTIKLFDPFQFLGLDTTLARMMGTHMIVVDPAHDALVLKGAIHGGLLADTQRAIAQAKARGVKLNTLILERSPGGIVDDVDTAGAAMRSAGINHAVVIGKCMSACAVLWAAFPTGQVSAGGALGFHGIHFGPISQKARNAIIDRYEVLLEHRGFSVAMVHRFEHIPENRIYLMTQADIANIGQVVPTPPVFKDMPLPGSSAR